MEELYLARSIDPEGAKLVVLKKVHPNFAENAKFVQLFWDEAKLAARLDHPNIAHVYDVGRDDGNCFVTMEYVHGQDVQKILRRSTRGDKMPIEHAVLIGRDVASALHYAHERRGPDGDSLGVVHRDVSPSNIVVSYEGAVKLLDFGVAKAASSTDNISALKGKVAYMSPEQAKGAAVDRRSDIFSAGIVLWEMLATQRLYKGDNYHATIELIRNQTPPLVSTVRPESPPELDRIIARALAQDPAKRYQTAQELQSDLDELARETKLAQSSSALGAHMGTLFVPEIQAWRDAQARGTSLIDHLLSSSTMPQGHSFDDDSQRAASPVKIEADAERTERTEVPLPPPVMPALPPRRPTPVPPVIARVPTPITVPPIIARATTPPPVTRAPTPPPVATTRAPTPPPVATTRAPTPPPVAAPAAEPPATAPDLVSAPPKKKKRRGKEPKSWKSEPSIVLDAELVVAIADTMPEGAAAVDLDPPTDVAIPRITSARDDRTMLVTAIVDPTLRSHKMLWISVTLAAAIVIVAAMFELQRTRPPTAMSTNKTALPPPEPPAPPAPPQAIVQPDPPAPTPTPTPTPTPQLVTSPHVEEGATVAKHGHVHMHAPIILKVPPKKKDPKFDPDAPLPPM